MKRISAAFGGWIKLMGWLANNLFASCCCAKFHSSLERFAFICVLAKERWIRAAAKKGRDDDSVSRVCHLYSLRDSKNG